MANRFYTGVRPIGSVTGHTRKFVATVRSGGMTFNCGTHDTEIEAAKARDKMIISKCLDLPLQVLKPIKQK